MKRSSPTPLALILPALVAPAATHAATAVTNRDNPDTKYTNSVLLGTASTSFTTGGEPSLLNSFTVDVIQTGSRGTTFTASLWTDADDHPGTAIESFAGQLVLAGNATLTFPSQSLPTLAPHATYWLQLMADGAPSYWVDTVLPTETSAFGWTIGDVTLPYEQPLPVPGVTYYPIGRLSVDATILPEPATLSLAAAALAAPLLARRRRRTV